MKVTVAIMTKKPNLTNRSKTREEIEMAPANGILVIIVHWYYQDGEAL